MEIEYTPVFADYLALNLYVLRKQFRWLIPLAILALAVFIAAPWIPQFQATGATALARYRSMSNILLLPGIIAFSALATYVAARRRWAGVEELRAVKHYTFTDAGIRMQSDSVESFAEWANFKEAEITKKYVFLATPQRSFHYFPIAVLPDINRFKTLLSAKIPVKMR